MDTRRHFIPLLAMSIALTWLVACGGGISQAEFDAVQQQATQAQQRVTTLQQELATEQSMASDLETQLVSEQAKVTELQQRLSTAEGDTTDLQQQLDDQMAKVEDLEGQLDQQNARIAELQQELSETGGPVSLAVSADMVRGHANPQGPSCALTSRYQQGEMVVWRARITDPATSNQLPAQPEELVDSAPTEDALTEMMGGYDVTVRLEDGQTFPMHFGGHGRPIPTDYFWTASWEIPFDYPTGTISYEIMAQDPEGRTGTFDPMEIGASALNIVERVESPLILAVDIVRGHTALAGPSCALTSRFPRGELVVWRAYITDSETGNMIPANPSELLAQDPMPTSEEAEALSEGIEAVVHLEDGQTFPMHFHPHGRPIPTDYFWTASWEVPADYPTGTLDYRVTVDWPEEGKSGQWTPPNVSSSKLTVEEALPVAFNASSASITVDGDTTDWNDIASVPVTMQQPRPIPGEEWGELGPMEASLRVATDSERIYVLMEVPDDFDYNPDDHHFSPAIGVMIRIDEPAAPHMGTTEEEQEISLGKVDIWHWELDCGPGEMSGGVTGISGGNDPECNFDDEWSTTPEEREDDGSAQAENSLAGVWDHTARDQGTGAEGTWIFEMSRMLQTGDPDDAQLTPNGKANLALAYWDADETPDLGWTAAGHLQSATGGWIEVTLP